MEQSGIQKFDILYSVRKEKESHGKQKRSFDYYSGVQ